MPALREICRGADGILRPQENRLRVRLYHQRAHGQAHGAGVPPLRQHGRVRPDQGRKGQVPRLR